MLVFPSARNKKGDILLYQSALLVQIAPVSEEIHPITYRFKFPTGETKEFVIELMRPSLALVPQPLEEPLPVWTELTHQQCSNCPLSANEHKYCPIARNLVGVVNAFQDVFSHEESDVEVTTTSRMYSAHVKNTQAVGSLIGVYMVTSGCPVMDRLRPMVLTHLPFASTEESIYRSISMYLMAQYFRMRKGYVPDWDMKRFPAFFEEVTLVNQSFVKRLTTYVERGASLNAVVLLNCFATATRRMITQERFDEIAQMFNAYFTDEAEP